MDTRELVDAIRSLNAEDAFRARLLPEQWQSLAPYLSRHEIRAGDLLIQQGDRDRCMYFLERGTLQVFVTRTAGAAHQRIALLRAGSVVGEAGLFGDTPRMANVEAVAPCVVWALRAPRFEELCLRAPSLGLEVVRAAASVLAVRLHANMEKSIPIG